MQEESHDKLHHSFPIAFYRTDLITYGVSIRSNLRTLVFGSGIFLKGSKTENKI